MRKFLVVPIILLILLMILPTVVQASFQHARYFIPVIVENTSATSYSNVRIVIPMNPKALIDLGILQSDADDSYLLEGTNELRLCPKALAANNVFWTGVVTSVPAYSRDVKRLWVANPQQQPVDRKWLASTSDHAFIPHHPTLNITNMLTMAANINIFNTNPIRENYIINKNSYQLLIHNNSVIARLNATPTSRLVGGAVIEATRRTSQRKSFFAEGRVWIFYWATGPGATGNIVFRSSADDGVTWTPPTSVPFVVSNDYSVWFDGKHLHVVSIGPGVNQFSYRMGDPNPDGTITWIAPEQIITLAVGPRNVVICTDNEGYPWIAYHGEHPDRRPHVIRSMRKDGLWTTAPGFPFQLSPLQTPVGMQWTIQIIPLATPDTIFIAYTHANLTVRARTWRAGAMGGEEVASVNPIFEGHLFSICAIGNTVHLVYVHSIQPDPFGPPEYHLRHRVKDVGWLPESPSIASGFDVNSDISLARVAGTLHLYTHNRTPHTVEVAPYVGGTWRPIAPVISEGSSIRSLQVPYISLREAIFYTRTFPAPTSVRYASRAFYTAPVSVSHAISPNTDYRVRATYNQVALRLFINDTEVASTPYTAPIATNTRDVTILNVDGVVDDLRIGAVSLTSPTWRFYADFDAVDIGKESIEGGANDGVYTLGPLPEGVSVRVRGLRGRWHHVPIIPTPETPADPDVEPYPPTGPGTAPPPITGGVVPPKVIKDPVQPSWWFERDVPRTLPLYNEFKSTATELGWHVNTLYAVTAIIVSVCLGVGAAVATGSTLVGAIGTGLGLFAGVAMGALGLWVLVVYALFAGTYLYVSRWM